MEAGDHTSLSLPNLLSQKKLSPQCTPLPSRVSRRQGECVCKLGLKQDVVPSLPSSANTSIIIQPKEMETPQ